MAIRNALGPELRRSPELEAIHHAVAGLDVHKKTVVAVVLQSDSEEDQAAAVFGTTRHGLNELTAFLQQHGVTHAAMEPTAQYWRPVGMASKATSR